jgi:hypothetical protein
MEEVDFVRSPQGVHEGCYTGSPLERILWRVYTGGGPLKGVNLRCALGGVPLGVNFKGFRGGIPWRGPSKGVRWKGPMRRDRWWVFPGAGRWRESHGRLPLVGVFWRGWFQGRDCLEGVFWTGLTEASCGGGLLEGFT